MQSTIQLNQSQVDGAESMLRQFCVSGADPLRSEWFAAFVGESTFFYGFDTPRPTWQRQPEWPDLLADGIARGVGRALLVASGTSSADDTIKPLTRALRAKPRDMASVRLICCDAQAYDSGWVEPERLLESFGLRGRDCTI